MSKEQFRQQFFEKAEQAGFKVETDYSGRGMFGDTCPAVFVNDSYEMQDFFAQTGLSGCRTDNMGLGFVIYTG